MPDSNVPQDGFFESEDEAQGQPSAAPAKTVKRRRRSMFDDPVVRTLAWVSVGLVILFLVTIISALLTGVLGSNIASTGVQRDISLLSQTVQTDPKDAQTQRALIEALIDDGQLGRAQEVADAAFKVADQASTQAILMAQAEIWMAQKKYDKAIKAADDIQSKLKAYHDAQAKKPGTPESLGEKVDDNYWDSMLLKAEALAKLGKNADAIKVLDVYIKANAGQSDVLVRRGSLKLIVGDKTGAAADFREALKFVPDDKAALEGLKKIGAQ